MFRKIFLGTQILKIAIGFIIVSITSICLYQNNNMEALFHQQNEELVPESEVVKKVIIFTTYRSGSSFLGDVVQSHNESYYFFEPIRFMTEFSKTPVDDSVYQYINDLLDCNFRPWVNHIRHLAGSVHLAVNNAYKVKPGPLCPLDGTNVSGGNCYDLDKASEICSKSKLRVIKMVRMYLVVNAERLLNDIEGLQILYLVRDPRGVVQSRKKGAIQSWCINDESCSSISYFCEFIHEEFQYALYLDMKYPERFATIRFEELACQPFKMSEYIFRFLGFPNISQEVSVFLNENTDGNHCDKKDDEVRDVVYSTCRDSGKIAFSWHNSQSSEIISTTENECGNLFGTIYTNFSLKANENCDCQGIIDRNELCYPNKKYFPTHLSEKNFNLGLE